MVSNFLMQSLTPATLRARLGFCLILGSVLMSASHATEKLLFRYLDEQGQLVLNGTLPPSAASRGYEVIRPDGTLVKSVEPAVSDDQAEESQRRRDETERRRKWDESLLLRYSDVADIQDAKKRTLGDIQVRISILKGNLNYLKTQVEREESRAAEAERQGLEVSQEQKEAIRTLKWQIGDVEDLIEVRQNELNATTKRFDKEIERFQILLDELNRVRR